MTQQHLGHLIGSLDELLRRERAAIGRLDAAAVEALAPEKQALADELGRALGDTSGVADDRVRRELRRLAARLLATAEANRALLADAIDCIASARGLKAQPTGAYDARARVTQRVRITGGKRI